MTGVDLAGIAEEIGTPAYVYAGDVIRRQFRALDDAFASVPHRIHYAVKANGNLAVLRLLRELGAGADIVSRGELARALAAGFPPDRIVFSGVGKRIDELEAAARAGIGSVNVESVEELAALGRVANAMDQTVRVGVRFNPDVTPETHPFISTGQSGIKFGIPTDQVGEIVRLLRANQRLELVTLAIHIGSQVLDIGPYQEAVRRLLDQLVTLRSLGVSTVTTLDLGGGLGIRYSHEEPLAAGAFADAVVPLLGPAGLSVHLEPGRFLVGAAGLLLTRVLYRKQAGSKVFAVVDAGMTELVRPSRYSAYHHIVPVVERPGSMAT
ncbi:MAG: diaminopimelate decarboxylase, partial [Gemmatimonadota bacterium]|nr:diaminopimelate decarboxylase [Gemmatimonadota bacterium]